jgi:endonuclease-3
MFGGVFIMAKSLLREIDWNKAFRPLMKKYRGKKHPLDYKNRYQLIVMVILSAQATDKLVNDIAPALLQAYPSMKELGKAKAKDIYQYIGKIRNFANKTNWLMSLAKTIGTDDKIPTTMGGLTALPGIGRKSANVIIRETGGVAEGIIVDLHVVRVAPRLGVAVGTDPKKIETQLMQRVAPEHWNDIGMALSFLGREICRPTNPSCDECVMNSVCAFYASTQ